MPAREKSASAINLKHPQYFLNRELSWLEFNYRVLSQALDSRTPLLERLKFSAIFSSNLDEFLMVRVASLKKQVDAGVTKLTPDGRSPQQQLTELEQRWRSLVALQYQNFEQELLPQLAASGVKLLNYEDLTPKQIFYCENYFEQQVFPLLTPLGLDPEHPFPHIANLSLNLAVVINNIQTRRSHFARIEIPDVLPRFVELPSQTDSVRDNASLIWSGIPIEQIIAHHLPSLFPGLEVQGHSLFRITRDADFSVQSAEADDLLLLIQQEIEKRDFQGSVLRLEIQTANSELIEQTLISGLNLATSNVERIEGLIHLGDLMPLTSLPLPNHKDADWQPIIPPRLKAITQLTSQNQVKPNLNQDIFAIIRRQDLLVHHPYESFSDSVELFINQAAADPHVLAIKMTLYRTYCASCDSPIIKALIVAAKAEKQVPVLVELKARFDEETNIVWAKKLEEAGVSVIYGVVGLKTHTKIALVVRKEETAVRRYVHIGTGNYNPKTAGVYTDLGLLSCRQDLGEDVSNLFNFLTGYSQLRKFRKLLVAPVYMRDPEIIAALYAASQAGVQIELIVRGICCLRPNVPGVSQNIRVLSVVGRYLEHSRIFYYHNNGQSEIYLGSADWMPRNLNRRVETVTPVEELALINQLKEVLDIMLSDNRYAWELQPDGTYKQRNPQTDEAERSAQNRLMEMARLKDTQSMSWSNSK